jgi:hypothetical protein
VAAKILAAAAADESDSEGFQSPATPSEEEEDDE